jgi:hypothetical protein
MNPPSHDRLQNAHAQATNQRGIAAVIAILLTVHGPIVYCRSMAKNSVVDGSDVAGAGNQNMLDSTATIVSTMPETLFLYAK